METNRLLTGQHFYNNASGRFLSGFNRKIYGETYQEAFSTQYERTDIDMVSGWNAAEKLIDKGDIYYVHDFHNLECDKGYAFQYGGFWVCNSCGGKGVDRNWWTIKVYKDGDEWCCVGEDFDNLQCSDNYAFGKTRDEAISNYGNIFVNKDKQ
jgi:hypothetical protein